MREENTLRIACLHYQTFMERAYGPAAHQKPALQSVGMRNLIMAEKGILISEESVIHFKEQLAEMKKYMEEALDHYMASPNVPGYVTMELMWYKNQVPSTANSEELLKIVVNTLDLTNTLYKTEL